MGPKRGLTRLAEKDITLILLSAAVLPALYACCGNAAFLEILLFSRSEALFGGFCARVAQFAVLFLLVLVVPMFHIALQVRQPFPDFGLGAGSRKEGIIAAVALILAVILPVAWMGARLPEVQAEYPLWKGVPVAPGLAVVYYLAYAGLYYTAWEFYFRGYLLFGLAGRFGAFNAVLLQTIPSVLLHIGKPYGELIGSIPFGIALGFLALRTGSIWYGYAIHVALGILTDLFIVFGGF